MLLDWFNARESAKAGTALADQFTHLSASGGAARSRQKAVSGTHGAVLQMCLRRGVHEIRALRLNFYKRATFANSFKWRLLENGVDAGVADEVTRTLVLHVSLNQTNPAPIDPAAIDPAPAAPSRRPDSRKVKRLLSLGQESIARGAYDEAVTHYQELVRLVPARADLLNQLGAVLCKRGRYKEAEEYFRKAIGRKPKCAEALGNLGAVQLWRGQFAEAEKSLRRALKLEPDNVDQRSNLGLTLIYPGRLGDATAQFQKVLKLAPRHASALHGMGLVAGLEGRFDDAAAMFQRALKVAPKMPHAWAALISLRKAKSSDRSWLERAQEIAASGIAPLEEAGLRFAIGKYFDDVEQFERAFRSYQRANQLLKTVAEDYDPGARTRLVDDLIRVYTRQTIASAKAGASASMKPVFVVGMPRSGTSLAEQIIASHPAAAGAGELQFWHDAVRRYETVIRREPLGEAIRKELSEGYLRALTGHGVDAVRVVDKAPVNADYLGVIHSVFPNARIIYLRRDPIDTCLSCYFQQFSPSLTFTMDLHDLAHYYRQHQRLMAHWRATLAPDAILEVPYAGLIADQEGWSRKLLEFIGLDWDQRCLDFHRTERSVVTASFWQVRQKIYADSVQRWRNYRKFIGPLLSLRDLDPSDPQ
ncbi:MAG: sulfotransferase [Steroidobacterales bacterium]